MTDPEFDGDGYPTEATLKAIATWDATDTRGLLDFIRGAWHYPERARVDGRTYTFSTGGWSGNEELLLALRANSAAWLFTWQESRRGGHHVFAVPNIEREQERRKFTKSHV
jgi:hypothetical protein